MRNPEGYRENAPAAKDLGAFILSKLPPLAEGEVKTVLDVGCGTGELAAELRRRGYHVVATDISPQMVDTANETFRSTKIEMGLTETDTTLLAKVCAGQDITKQFEVKSFDFVISNSTLHWLVGDNRRECLAGIKAVLKPEGRFINANASLGSEKAKLSQCLLEAMAECGIPSKVNWEWITPQTMKEDMRQAGFDVEAEGAIIRGEVCTSALPQGPEGWMRTFANNYLDRDRHSDDLTGDELDRVAELGGTKYREICKQVGQDPERSMYERHNDDVSPMRRKEIAPSYSLSSIVKSLCCSCFGRE